MLCQPLWNEFVYACGDRNGICIRFPKEQNFNRKAILYFPRVSDPGYRQERVQKQTSCASAAAVFSVALRTAAEFETWLMAQVIGQEYLMVN